MEDRERTLKVEDDAPARPGAQHPALIVLQGELAGRAIPLEGDRVILGRGAQADIVLRDDAASRQHAEIVRASGPDGHTRYYFKDLGSTNGSFLNGLRAAKQQMLRDGDKIKIGGHLLKFSLVDDIELEALRKTQPIPARQPARYHLRFPPFSIPSDVDLLYCDGEVVPLEPRAVRVLRYLAEHHDRVVPKEELLDAVWPDVFTTDAVLKRAISQARMALGDDARESQFIETYHRRGYRFIAAVERSAGG